MSTNLKIILFPSSSNAKTGNIIQSYSSRATCPEKCPLKSGGCYAEGYYTRKLWDRCDNPEDTRYVANRDQLRLALLEATIQHIKGLPKKNPYCFATMSPVMWLLKAHPLWILTALTFWPMP